MLNKNIIRLHPIKNQASPYWDSLVRIYRESFPIDEQRPIESIARLLTEEPRYTMHAIIDDNYAAELQAVGQKPKANSQVPTANNQKLLGLLTTWHFEEFIYIEHFAIDPTLRSQGYGSEALKAFIHEHGKPLVLEAEPPTDALSIRRIKFYERIGLTLYDFPYMQPAYTEDSHPVELRLMGTIDTEATPLTDVEQQLHREVYGFFG
jgi:ribosomal protein S18 acetylase RimI-like enzyme